MDNKQNHERETDAPSHKPRNQVVIRFCKGCGRDSLVQPLKANHYSGGSKCQGDLVVAIYTLTQIIEGA